MYYVSCIINYLLCLVSYVLCVRDKLLVMCIYTCIYIYNIPVMWLSHLCYPSFTRSILGMMALPGRFSVSGSSCRWWLDLLVSCPGSATINGLVWVKTQKNHGFYMFLPSMLIGFPINCIKLSHQRPILWYKVIKVGQLPSSVCCFTHPIKKK